MSLLIHPKKEWNTLQQKAPDQNRCTETILNNKKSLVECYYLADFWGERWVTRMTAWIANPEDRWRYKEE